MQPRPQQISLAALRRVFLNNTISLGLFAVVAFLILPTRWVPDALFAVSAAMAVGSAVIAPLVGRVHPLAATMPADQAREVGLVLFRRGLFLRFAIVTIPALFGLVASFVLDSTVPYLVNAVIAAVLMFLFVIPTSQRVRAAEARLDADGATSHLAAAFGL